MQPSRAVPVTVRWRGFNPAEAEREAEAPLFEFFGLNTG